MASGAPGDGQHNIGGPHDPLRNGSPQDPLGLPAERADMADMFIPESGSAGQSGDDLFTGGASAAPIVPQTERKIDRRHPIITGPAT
ncbi:hypothetical protein [Sphingorhabdus sp. M41]|uniref:hypothetical protein n=1 Tax=Sphingorhabdus sp. M41 TaxID=1806885 RepID=UPI00078C6737|nr:hypothetical protein [Sphingorhabdus sp. M41]AMO71100.1 hypothetical protein AZE99_03790 [Sphingorhabdus sp. M41]